MMRTVEVLLVIVIITGAFIISSFYAVLPQPRRVSPINLRRLALTTLQTLDTDHDLSLTAFKPSDDSSWANLEIALSACLPPNIVYNLTVYDVLSSYATLYSVYKSMSNVQNLGVGSDASSYLVASSNVTFQFTPEKIGGGVTLYILNCSDANGWWITGYTAQKFAEDLNTLLSPYFQNTIMVQDTTQLAKILNGIPLKNESLQNAVVINTFGEAVPIPGNYCLGGDHQSEGYEPHYDPVPPMTFNYTRYCYTLGKITRQFNWTWASVVGYPFYYVSNTQVFANDQNTYGIYGMQKVYQGGLNAFLQGMDNQNYAYNSQLPTVNTTSIIAHLSTTTQYYCNYYGIYPTLYQTSTRALNGSILYTTYHLNVTTYIFDPVGNQIAGAVYRNITKASGGFLALGLTRTPDIRLTALGLLCDYKPNLQPSDPTASGTSKLVILQLGQVGGV